MFNRINRVFAGLALAAAPFLVVPQASAIPLKDFLDKPVSEQSDLLGSTIGTIIDSLNAEVDSKGRLKSEQTLKANRALANYAIDLLVVRKGEDKPRIPEGKLELARLFYQAREKDPSMDHGKLTYAFIKTRYQDHIASLEHKKPSLPVAVITTASASSAVPSATVASITPPSVH